MDEVYYLFFVLGDRQLCPHCVEEAVFVKGEMALSEANESTVYPAEPWTQCNRCGLPMARDECVMAFERVMNALYELEYGTPPPFASPENIAVAKAHEEVRRLKAEVGAAYRKMAAARNKVIELRGRLSDEPVP